MERLINQLPALKTHWALIWQCEKLAQTENLGWKLKKIGVNNLNITLVMCHQIVSTSSLNSSDLTEFSGTRPMPCISKKRISFPSSSASLLRNMKSSNADNYGMLFVTYQFCVFFRLILSGEPSSLYLFCYLAVSVNVLLIIQKLTRCTQNKTQVLKYHPDG